MYLNQSLTIYTDGSCSPNTGRGGWASIILGMGDEPFILHGSEPETTNNRMELLGPLKALQHLQNSSQVTICTDSKYVRDGVSSWLQKWQENGWQTVSGEGVKNRDLWQQLQEQIVRHDVGWIWVKGHAGDSWNELADQLAAEARESENSYVIDKNNINIFLGVTCKHSTRTGGWASLLVYQNYHRLLGGRRQEVTANVLYLESVIESLKALKRDLPVTIHTSSGYLKDGAGSWLDGWQRRGWVTRDGKEVTNRAQWQAVLELQNRYRVNYQLFDKANPPCYSQEAKLIAREFEEMEGPAQDE